MTEIKELVARLREDARQMWNTGLVPKGSTPLAEQAASTIELLSSQVEDLKAALSVCDDLVGSLEEEFGESDDDSDPLDGSSMKTTFGLVRRARSALSLEAGKE